MDNISKHITYLEATHSNAAVENGVKNEPNVVQLESMKLVAEKCFEPTRIWYGKAIKINSFFRCPAVNKLVKGSPTSDHMDGKAIDITAGSITENKKLFEWMKLNLEFDQLIWENGGVWIHVSFRKSGNRQQIKNLIQKIILY